MHNYFKPIARREFRMLFTDEMLEMGIVEYEHPLFTRADRRCLSDGVNDVWVYRDPNGNIAFFACHENNKTPQRILDTASTVLHTSIFPAHDPAYWGFKTQEELDAAQKDGGLPPF